MGWRLFARWGESAPVALAPAPEDIGAEDRRFMGAMVLVVAVAAPMLLITYLAFHREPAELLVLAGLAILNLFSALLFRRRYFRAVPVLLTLTMLGYTVAGMLAFGSTRSIALLGFAATIVGGGLFMQARALAGVSALCIAMLGLVTWAESTGRLTQPDFSVGLRSWSLASIILVCFSLYVYFSRAMVLRAIRRQASHLQRALQAEQAARAGHAQQLRREALLEDMARGFSGESGQALIDSLAGHLAQAMQADLVCIADILPHSGGQHLALARSLVRDGRPSSTLPAFDLDHSPLAALLADPSQALCRHAGGVARDFAHDSLLVQERIESLVGSVLRDADGSAIGTLCAMWREPQELPAAQDALFRVFSSRINAEIVRARREREIRHLSERLELRVQERTAQLEAANAELESFAYSVSHDLRSPLRGIDGFTRILNERLVGRITPEEQGLLDRVVRNAARMNALITDLIGLAHINQGALLLEAVDLSRIAHEVLQGLAQVQPERRVALHFEPGIEALCDSRLARIVLENLLGNAWKYTARNPPERAASIHFGRAEPSGQRAPEASGARPWLVVSDNGAGFDMAYANQLFQPFHRLHHERDFEGSGIGLATVHRILERHGGAIEASGESGRGAQFRFRF